MPYALEGVNVGVITFGSSGSGKSFTLEGSKTEQGVVVLFADALFNAIAEKSTVYPRS